MRLSGTKTGSANQYNGLGDQLYDLGGARPTLDLNFANNGSLVDSVTGKTLVQHTRASSATYVDGDGVIRNAVTNYVRNSEDLNATGWGRYGTGTGSTPVVTANAGIAPDGTQTAWQVDFDKGAGTTSTDQSNVVSDPYFTTVDKRVFHSVYLKTTDGSTKRLRFDFNGASANVSPYNSYNITVTGEWQRFIIGYDSTVTDRKWTLRLRGSITPDDQPTASVYLWHPQTELFPINTGSPGEYVPTGATINSAPRFDHEVTRTTTNLIPYSEEFDDASWGGGASGNATVTPNAIAAPFGSITADLLDDTSTTQVQARSQVINIVSSTGSYTLSAFVRQNTSSIVSLRLGLGGATTINGEVVVDLATGAAQWRSGANVGTSFAITSAGGDWYRISVTVTDNGTGNNGASIELRPAFALTYTDTLNVTAQGSAYFWGVQLEQNDDVGPYVKTTGAAATKVDTESLGLLVEESRTNSVINNTMVGAVAGTPGTLPTNWPFQASTNGLAVSIVGTGTELGITYLDWKISGTTTALATADICFGRTAALTGQTWTSSLYVKLVSGSLSAVTTTFVRIIEEDASTNFIVGGSGAITLPTTASLGTQRGSFTRTLSGGATTALIRSNLAVTVSSGSTVDFTLRIGLPQLEQGAFATSVIPTSGTAATRAADVASISGNDFGVTNLLSYSEEFDNAAWGKYQSTITANTVIAPDGTLTADKLVENTATTTHIVPYDTAVTAGATYTFSVFFKAAERTFAQLRCGATSQFSAIINLSTGEVTDVVGSTTSSVINVGNGWWRFSISFAADTTPLSTRIGVVINSTPPYHYTGDGTSGIYLWGAQLEQGTTATPYIKSDVTWQSRASNATYYDSTGLLKKSSYNLLLRSEEFENVAWNSAASGGAGARTITPNSVAAPDGLLTADTVAADGTTASHFVSQSRTLSAVPYAYSVFAKAGTNDFLQLRTFNAFGGMWANFDLATGVVGTVGFVSGAAPTSSIQAYPNGWYRCTMAFTPTATTSSVAAYIVNSASAVGSEANSLSTTLYLWGAQLETGTYAGDYAKTEGSAASTARTAAYLPDGSGNFVSAGELLLEDAGTNLVSYSEDFSGYILDNVSVNQNSITSPDGTNNADYLQENTQNQRHRAYETGFSASAGTIYTISVFAKSSTRNCLINANSIFGARSSFALTGNGSVLKTDSGSATITNVGNGWYRCSVTGTAPNTATGSVFYQVQAGSSDVPYVGDGTSGIYLWGAQVEVGAFPTSYIPTQGSTATRAADVSTSAATFGNSWYRQDEGTVFAKASTSLSATGHVLMGMSTGSFASSVYTTKSGSNQLSVAPSIAPSNVSIFLGPIPVNTSFNHGFAFTADTGGSASAVLNGGTVVVDSATGIPVSMNRCGIGCAPWAIGTALWNGHIARLAYWPARLPDSTLQTITV